MTCHSRAMNFVLGPSLLQMNKDHVYPNGVEDNQLRVLEHLGLLRIDYMWHIQDDVRQRLTEAGKSDAEISQEMARRFPKRDPGYANLGPSTLLAFDPEDTKRLVDPYDKSQDLSTRARSYLHANCAICHIEGGGGNALLNLEYGVLPEKCRMLGVRPQHDTFGQEAARIIAPGRADSSVLLHRVSMRGPGQMPPLASSRVDERAVAMLREWIESLKPTADAGK
jgi:mono/diheme cytochrome c family protein